MAFTGLLLSKNDHGEFSATLKQFDDSDLPEQGNVVVDVEWSTLNYKDGLAITNRSPIVRQWPLVAGIDGAGRVAASSDPRWRVGDAVILNGWGVGESHWGCLAQRAKLNGDWLVALPAGMTTRDAMAIGTAGYTAMLSILALEAHGVKPEDGEILVTGATGGVGTVAIAVLSKLGYRVVASSGKPQEADFLTSLGAAEIIDRKTLSEPGKPLQKERWAGVIDAVGSHTLANACAQTRRGGIVTACGLAQGMDFPATVAPFILRAVTLAGIDSVMAPRAVRERAWQRLATDLDRGKLAALTTEISLGDAIGVAKELIDGTRRGRVVVDVNR